MPGLGRSSIEDWDVEGAHLAERCGLFIIIALGESLLVTGMTFAARVWDWATSIGFANAVLGTILMWWIYFDTGAKRATKRIERADDPGREARSAYTYVHALIVGGIIACAVADELVIAHPHHGEDAGARRSSSAGRSSTSSATRSSNGSPTTVARRRCRTWSAWSLLGLLAWPTATARADAAAPGAPRQRRVAGGRDLGVAGGAQGRARPCWATNEALQPGRGAQYPLVEPFRIAPMLRLLLAMCLLCLSSLAMAGDGQPNTYRVSIDDKAWRAHVVADVWQDSDVLSMFNIMPAEGLPNGQADLDRRICASPMRAARPSR